MRSILAGLLLVTVAGCSEAPPSAAVHPLELQSQPAPDGATGNLRGRQEVFVHDRVVFDVVARGAPDLHGAAFRLSWDPEALALVSAHHGPTWSKQSIALTKEALPGQLLVAWTEKGEVAIDATRETVLGTLTFDLRNHQPASVSFKTERSQLVSKKGTKLDNVAWRDATIAVP
jgi:hypothetical protein